eukprot:5896755-Pyramimonas_sp.AAC.1
MRAAVRVCEGFAPSAHDRSIAGAPRGDMTSLDLAEFIRPPWLLHGSSMGARTGHLQTLRCKTFCLFVLLFVGLYAEALAITLCLYGFGVGGRAMAL